MTDALAEARVNGLVGLLKSELDSYGCFMTVTDFRSFRGLSELNLFRKNVTRMLSSLSFSTA